MLTQWIRLIQDTSDISLENQGPNSIAADGSHVYYVGKKAPFNNFFLWLDTANTNSVSMAVSYWDGNAWIPVVDLLDGTFGASQSGVVQFSPNKDNQWQIEDDTSSNGPTGLDTFTIYDMYWLKVSFSGDLSASTTIKQLNYKFAEDADILMKDTDINEFLASFNQTDWTPQILQASIEVANDFKRKKLILDEGQILRFDDVAIPTAYKALFIIYLNLGSSYKEKRDEIAKLYDSSYTGLYTIDRNNNAVDDLGESNFSTNTMFR